MRHLCSVSLSRGHQHKANKRNTHHEKQPLPSLNTSSCTQDSVQAASTLIILIYIQQKTPTQSPTKKILSLKNMPHHGFCFRFFFFQFYNIDAGLPVRGFVLLSNFLLILFACRYSCKTDRKKVMCTFSFFFFFFSLCLSAQDTLQETFHMGVAVSL